LSFFVSENAEGKTWTVRQDGTGDHDEIWQAINDASDGDSIDIGPGHFEITSQWIDKELTIYGSGVDSTYINCDYDTSSFIFRIGHDDVVLSDFSANDENYCRTIEVTNSAQDVLIGGIKIYKVYQESLRFEWDTRVTLKNSIVGVAGESISNYGLIDYGNGCIIKNNVFYANSIRIYGYNTEITNNDISGTSDWSIYVANEGHTISGNTVTNSPENSDDQGGSRETAFDYLVGTRTDSNIDFSSTDGNFYSGQDSDYFGVIWEGSFYVEGDGGENSSEGGQWVEFYWESDDGYKVTIDGDVYRDYLDCYGYEDYYFSQWMETGMHSIKIEMLECTGSARAQLYWYTSENEPLAFEGKYYEHTPPVSTDSQNFKSIYLESYQNNVDITNLFEGSRFVMHYQQDGETASGYNMGTKKVSNFNSKIYIRESSNIEIDGAIIGYPSRIEVYVSNSVKINNCEFNNGYIYLQGTNHEFGFNTDVRTLNVDGNSNNIHHNTLEDGNAGIFVSGGDGNTISDNQIDGSVNSALDITTSNNVISGNQITNSGSWSIVVGGSGNTISGNTVSGSPTVIIDSDFQSIYLNNLQNTVDETNSFEQSKFISYYNQNGKVLSGIALGSKKVSNYNYRIHISNSENIEISGLSFNYLAYVQAQNSNSITVKNCDFLNGYLSLSGNNNLVQENSFTTVLPQGNSYREIYTSGEGNTISGNYVANGIDSYGGNNHIHNNSIEMGRGDGLHVNGDNNKIVYNDIDNATTYGIYSGGSGNLIDGNKVIESSGMALYIGSTSGTTVTERNLLKGSCVVLYSDLVRTKENKKVIENCDYSDLSGPIWNLDYYVSLRESGWITIDSLTYENIDKGTGIYIVNSHNISINSVRITGKKDSAPTGIDIQNSEYISVSNSNFGDLSIGIDSYANLYLDLESNTLTNCAYGITDYNSGDITVEGNTLRNAAFAIDLTNSVFFTIEDNELRNDRIREMLGIGIGIFVTDSIHGSVIGNDVSGFDLAGIVYYTVSYLVTENNKIYDNGVGIDLYEISPRVYLKIHHNDIYDNQQYGLYSDSPVDARFNWWGDPSGPYQRCESQEGCEGNVNTEGKGNPVNSNVDASEQLYASGQGFTIVNSIQAIAYEYKFPIILIVVVAIVGIIAWRRGWLEDWGSNSFAPVNTYPMASAVVEKPAPPKRPTIKKKAKKTVTIQCTNCSEKISVEKKGKLQTITCESCGTSGEIDL
jgi:parallel beta-helix repeat protein